MNRITKLFSNPMFLILIIALLLRLIGITHGLPFVFHPDEPTVVRSALGIRFDINPNHFDWPHLFIYLNYFLYMAFASVRNVLPHEMFQILWVEPDIFYLISRIFCALLGALSLIPVYLSGKNLFSKKTGILSAIVFATIPFHVWHSHYALIDVPMTFFVAWVVYFCSLILIRVKVQDYLLAGLFVGFAASTKYNGGLTAISVFMASIFQDKLDIRKIKFLILAGLSSILGFLLGTPFALLDYQTFLRDDGPAGALWQFKNVGSVSLADYPLQLINILIAKLPDDFGYVYFYIFLLFFVIIIINSVKNGFYKYKYIWFLMLSSIFVILYIAHFDKARSHYFMLSYPFISIVCGYAINMLIEKASKYWQQTIIAACIFLLPVMLSIKNSYIFYRGDTRELLYKKAIEFIPESDIIIYNADAFKPLLDKMQHSSKKGLANIAKYSSGYIFINYDSSLTDELDFNEYKFDVLADIPATYRLGNNVALLKFTKL